MNNKDSLNFGNIVYRERKKRGISLQDLADLIGQDEKGKYRISQSYLSRLENNEYDNPSINNILIITSKLSLDLNEVLKSLGFGELIETKKDLSFNNIEQLIRICDIEAPLMQYNKSVIDYANLDYKEKDILISLITSIFMVGTCKDDSVLFNTSKILKDLEEFRACRNNTVKMKLDTESSRTYELNGFEISFTAEANKQLSYFSFVHKEEIFKIIMNQDDMPYINGLFAIVDKTGCVSIQCIKLGNKIEVVTVSEIFYGE